MFPMGPLVYMRRNEKTLWESGMKHIAVTLLHLLDSFRGRMQKKKKWEWIRGSEPVLF